MSRWELRFLLFQGGNVHLVELVDRVAELLLEVAHTVRETWSGQVGSSV